jgi:hypothetical protein
MPSVSRFPRNRTNPTRRYRPSNFILEAATADAFRWLEIHRVSVDAAAHHVGSDWSLTLLRSLNDDQPRAATVSLSGSLG